MNIYRWNDLPKEKQEKVKLMLREYEGIGKYRDYNNYQQKYYMLKFNDKEQRLRIHMEDEDIFEYDYNEIKTDGKKILYFEELKIPDTFLTIK